LKETINVHKDVSLLEILKVKQCISVRIEDFNIDGVLDEETQVNIMKEDTWEILGKPTVVLVISPGFLLKLYLEEAW
jgi:hypothetical protein